MEHAVPRGPETQAGFLGLCHGKVVEAGVGRPWLRGASSRPVPMVVGPLTTFRHAAPDASRAAQWLRAASLAVPAYFPAERERWPLWLPAGFGAGIAAYFAIPFEPSAATDR